MSIDDETKESTGLTNREIVELTHQVALSVLGVLTRSAEPEPYPLRLKLLDALLEALRWCVFDVAVQVKKKQLQLPTAVQGGVSGNVIEATFEESS